MSILERQARFRELLERSHPRWTGIARAYAEACDRDDLVQEIALQVWRSLDRFAERSSLDTWAYRVALNTALAWRRKAAMRSQKLARSTANIAELPGDRGSEGDVKRVLDQFLASLNKRAITKHLIPHRNELANLLGQLENAGSDTVPLAGQPVECALTRRQTVLVFGFMLTLAALGLAGAFFLEREVDYPKRAPFSGVRWEEGQPVVKIGEDWFVLVSLDGIAARDIVAFSQRTYWLRWKMRFEEDLVEVLTRMGHEPGDSVRLVVRPLGSSTTRTLENVPMTEANRQAIYRARN